MEGNSVKIVWRNQGFFVCSNRSAALQFKDMCGTALSVLLTREKNESFSIACNRRKFSNFTSFPDHTLLHNGLFPEYCDAMGFGETLFSGGEKGGNGKGGHRKARINRSLFRAAPIPFFRSTLRNRVTGTFPHTTNYFPRSIVPPPPSTDSFSTVKRGRNDL